MNSNIWNDEPQPWANASASITIRLAREQLWQNQPPARQAETMERVRRLVEEQPNSWLARHWREIYT